MRPLTLLLTLAALLSACGDGDSTKAVKATGESTTTTIDATTTTGDPHVPVAETGELLYVEEFGGCARGHSAQPSCMTLSVMQDGSFEAQVLADSGQMEKRSGRVHAHLLSTFRLVALKKWAGASGEDCAAFVDGVSTRYRVTVEPDHTFSFDDCGIESEHHEYPLLEKIDEIVDQATS